MAEKSDRRMNLLAAKFPTTSRCCGTVKIIWSGSKVSDLCPVQRNKIIGCWTAKDILEACEKDSERRMKEVFQGKDMQESEGESLMWASYTLLGRDKCLNVNADERCKRVMKVEGGVWRKYVRESVCRRQIVIQWSEDTLGFVAQNDGSNACDARTRTSVSQAERKQTLPCNYPDCTSRFISQALLHEHIRSVHIPEEEQLSCPYPECQWKSELLYHPNAHLKGHESANLKSALT